WDEYHGPIAAARQQDSDWPFTPARRKALQRWQQFIGLVKVRMEEEKEKEEGHSVESLQNFLDAMTAQYKNKTINSIREEFLKR
ncbi:hypothetical protein BGZ54_005136, partial [Gamsiella multidivaricata]